MGFRRTVADPTIADQWQHFVIQQDTEGTVQLWINGALLAEWPQGALGQQFGLSGDVFIGATINGVDNMTGQLDDFAIFDGPIPGPHIQSLASGISVGNFYKVGPQPLVISNITRDDDTMSLTWSSKENTIYTLKYSSDLINWEGELDDSVEATPGADTTTYTFDLTTFGLSGVDALFFRVEE